MHSMLVRFLELLYAYQEHGPAPKGIQFSIREEIHGWHISARTEGYKPVMGVPHTSFAQKKKGKK